MLDSHLASYDMEALLDEIAARIAQDHIDQLDEEDRKTLETEQGRSGRAAELVELQDVGLEDRVFGCLTRWASVN